MERDLVPRLENPLQPQITVRQLDILRLLGKGNSPSEISVQFGYQNNDFVFGEIKEMGQTFGVSGRTPTVVSALDNGLLNTSEMVEEDFEWRRIDQLRPQFKAILEAFIHTKAEDLTDEEFKNLKAETTQTQKAYINKAIEAMLDKTGLKNKTELVVYYYAWRERQPEIEQTNNIPVETELFTDRQAEVFRLLAQGLDPSKIAVRLNIAKHTVLDYRSEILKKLEVTSIKEAEKKVREIGGILRG